MHVSLRHRIFRPTASRRSKSLCSRPHHILYIVATLFLAILGPSLPTQAKDVNNFYFDSFDADYYITRDDDGISHMRVVETLTAVFPDYEQNLGIVRYIPSTNQSGANITVPSVKSLNLSVTHNGLTEPIYDIEEGNGYYAISTGDDTTYLLGEQVFVFEYEFEKVITDFNNYQELYWDTNGTGWAQRFNSVTARVHFDSRLASALNTDAATPSCYVGSQGANGSDRCTITRIANGYQFTADALSAGENLTFAIPLAAGTFVVPITINLVFIIVALITGVVFIITAILLIKYLLSIRTQRNFYKNLFLKPEYQPMPDLDVAEAAKISLINTADSRVASLIELAVSHKITLIKEGKSDWKIRVNSLSDISSDQRTVLTIMNGGEALAEDFEFTVEKHSPTVTLQNLSNKYTSGVTASLERKGLLLSKQSKPTAKLADALTIISIIWAFAAFALFNLLLDQSFGVTPGAPFSLVILAIAALAIFVVPLVVTSFGSRYAKRSEAGLRAARYFEGLRLYMKMAEADRLKFLQSVDGADTTSTGIVKLYEKLLPYAIIFGLESSWMKELSHYYDMDEVGTPDWYIGTSLINSHDFQHFVASSSVTISRSTISSSSSSGSSGGGFSGGGGGGGGGGGR